MGYWGTLIAVHATDVPAALAGRAVERRDHDTALRGDGWQVYSVPDDLVTGGAEPLHRLAAEAGPVLAAYIADSDYGWLAGISPAGDWNAWLDPDTAFEYERDHQMMTGADRAEATRRAKAMIAGYGLPPREAAKQAVRWAAEAGYTVPAGPVRHILATRRPPGSWLPGRRYVFAEEMFFALLDRLGIPRTVGSMT